MFDLMIDFPFNFGQKSSLLLIFFFQGIVFSSLCLRLGYISGRKSSKWLSLLLFLCSLYIAPFMCGYAGWYGNGMTRDILFFVPFMQLLIIGPTVYFYLKSLLEPSSKFQKHDLIHFIPGLLYLTYSLIVFITDKIILDDYYFYADQRDKDLSNWYQVVGVVSMGFYLVLSLLRYHSYKKRVFETLSYADSVLFKWIRNFMIAFLGLLVLRVLFFISNPDWGSFGNQFWYYISFAVVFFYISITGYSNAVKLSILDQKIPIPEPVKDDVNESGETIESQAAEPTEDLEPLKVKLDAIVIEKELFKNPKLTLLDVANELGTTSKTISSIVNSGYQVNFNDFINKYRVTAVQYRLQQNDDATLTVLGIALECGFNSKATFNRAFKKHTSMTPRKYVASLGR